MWALVSHSNSSYQRFFSRERAPVQCTGYFVFTSIAVLVTNWHKRLDSFRAGTGPEFTGSGRARVGLGSGSGFENRYRVGLGFHEIISKPVGLRKILNKSLVKVKSLTHC